MKRQTRRDNHIVRVSLCGRMQALLPSVHADAHTRTHTLAAGGVERFDPSILIEIPHIIRFNPFAPSMSLYNPFLHDPEMPAAHAHPAAR